jgi:hypothetical protein
MRPATALFVALLAAGAAAQDRADHRGALGLTLAGGAELGTALGGGLASTGLRAPLELGVSYGFSERTELHLAGRFSPPWPRADWSVLAGLRNYRGERWKTFFDLDLVGHLAPIWTLGLRLGLGVQFEVLPVLGVFAVAGVQGGGGAGLRLAGELLLGVQVRSYLFY